MELYQLRAFATVAELGHLTKAAERLHVSQPAVSGQIRALEDELGVDLFNRGPGGMSLTEAGARLLPIAEKVLATALELKAEVQLMKGQIQGTVRVGTVSDPTYLRLGEFLSRVVERHPLLHLEMHKEISGEALEEMRATQSYRLVHEALTKLGPVLGLVAEQVPAEVLEPSPANE